MNMFRRLTMVALLVSWVGFAYTTSAIAGDSPVRFVGKLVKIDGQKLIIASTADDKNHRTVVTCNDATKFRRDADNQWVKFADIKVGQTLRVYYLKADHIASLVNIAKPGSK
jgi:hypothetical protein